MTAKLNFSTRSDQLRRLHLRLLLDGIAFENPYQRGIQRYFREVLGRLVGAVDVELVLARESAVDLPSRCNVLTETPRLLERGNRSQLLRRVAMQAGNLDLFHSTFFTTVHGNGPPEVVTVYDMIVERYADVCGRAGRVQARMKGRAIPSAKSCIAISQATADELLHFYPQMAGKVHVIYLGADHGPASDSKNEARPIETSYAIHIGDRHTYKNFDILLKALTQADWPKDMKLVTAGPPFHWRERLRIRGAGLGQRIVHLHGPTDGELWNWVRHAACLVVPSLCEGFGLPLIEAQRCGTPVVCSDIAVFRELADGTALFFDPKDPAAVARGVCDAAKDSVGADLSRAGLANAGRFTWQRCAQETLSVYEEAQR